MSDTPTYASLLTRLFSDNPEDRSEVMDYLTNSEPDRKATEQEIRDRLRDPAPGIRVIAAEVMVRVYGDRVAAAATLAGLFQLGDPAVAADTIGTLQLLRSSDVAPLLLLLIRHVPQAFTGQTAAFHRWAGAAAIEAGPAGLEVWLVLQSTTQSTALLMMGLADAAPKVEYDLTPVEEQLRRYLGWGIFRIAAGAALWRVTWRVNRTRLDCLDPYDTQFANDPGLHQLILEVLIEHLGRRPDLAGLVRDMLATLVQTDPDGVDRAIGQLAALGSRGWGVLIPMLHPTRSSDRFSVDNVVRKAIYREAATRPAVFPLIHHHAHGVIVAAVAEGGTTELVTVAAHVLTGLGVAAGMAVPDLLSLAAKFPDVGTVVGETLVKIAGGYPNAPASIVQTLSRIHAARTFGAVELAAFCSLAQVLAELDPDVGPSLVENTGVDFRVLDLLIQHPGWKGRPAEIRRRHVRTVADLLGSSRPEVRIRAASVLPHYGDELPSAWPALVAVLTGADQNVAVAVLPCFRYLSPVADEVSADVITLFRETNPAYAARAVVALWWLRTSDVAHDLRSAVETSAENDWSWGWTILRGVVDGVAQTHRLSCDLMEVFTAAPSDVAAKVDVMLNQPESSEEARFTACVPRPDDPSSPTEVNWDAIRQMVQDELAGLLLFVALMCEHGSAGYAPHKIWLIKNLRSHNQLGLYECKGICERVTGLLSQPGASAGDRHVAVRDLFSGRTELPVEIVALLDHPLNWFRWAGLELADAWDLTSEQVSALTENKVRI